MSDINHHFRFHGVAAELVLTWGDRSSSGWACGASIGLLLGDRCLADTRYGAAPVYAAATRTAYEAKAGLIAARLAVNRSKRLSTDWRLFGYARVDSVAGAASRRSPLVDRPTGASAAVGLAWTWLRPEDSAAP